MLRFGHLVVAIQPARGYNIDPKASYHDPDLVPPHAYFALYFWLRQIAPGGVIAQPLDTRWMAWVTLAAVVVWLGITQKLRQQTLQKKTSIAGTLEVDIECERFPDQCPCTTELGKGVA